MNRALIVVDMQKAFFANSNLQKNKAKMIAACNQLIEEFKLNRLPIYMLRTVHNKTKETWTLNMLDDEEGYLFYGDDDSDYVKGLDIENKIEIIKTRDSGFWETNLLSSLRGNNIDCVVICGVSTHSCVALTAIDAYNANLRVELAVEAIASHDPRYHDTMLAMLHQEYRMKLRNNNEIV